ncbi:MAG: hypothetical protein U0T73_11725 [Chitinophagales bacterium]
MKNLFAISLIFLWSAAPAQKKTAGSNDASRCEVIRTLIVKAQTKVMKDEARENIPNDDMETWKAATTLPGATRCIIQDAVTTKAYIAEFGFVYSKNEDATLTQQYNNLVNEFKNCFKNEFKENVIHPEEGILHGSQFEGLGKNADVNVNFFQLYNPAEKKQYVSITIMYDPE